MLTFDHIAVLGNTLAEAVSHTEAALGRPLGPGGQHSYFGTHNKLMGLAPRLYLEAIAIDPDAPPPAHARWFGLDGFDGPPRLDKWVCRVPDMAAALEALPMAGQPVHLTRGELSWTMAVPEDGVLPFDGRFPALIQWHSANPPGQSLPNHGFALERLVVQHPQAEDLAALLAPYLDDDRIVFVPGTSGMVADLRNDSGPLQLA